MSERDYKKENQEWLLEQLNSKENRHMSKEEFLELIQVIREANEYSNNQEERINRLREEIRNTAAPVRLEELREELRQLEEDRQYFESGLRDRKDDARTQHGFVIAGLLNDFNTNYNDLLRQRERLEEQRRQIILETDREREIRVAQLREEYERHLREVNLRGSENHRRIAQRRYEMIVEMTSSRENEIANIDQQLRRIIENMATLQQNYIRDTEEINRAVREVVEGIAPRGRDTDRGESPSTGNDQEQPTGNGPERQTGDGPERQTGDEPERTTGDSPEQPTNEKNTGYTYKGFGSFRVSEAFFTKSGRRRGLPGLDVLRKEIFECFRKSRILPEACTSQANFMSRYGDKIDELIESENTGREVIIEGNAYRLLGANNNTIPSPGFADETRQGNGEGHLIQREYAIESRELTKGEIPPEPPSQEPPSKEPPSQEPPSKEPPSQEPPSQEPPSKEPPSQEPPSKEPPSQEPPSKEPPSQEPPTRDGIIPPTQEPPSQEPPSKEPPSQEPPSKEPPSQEPPSKEPPKGPRTWEEIHSEILERTHDDLNDSRVRRWQNSDLPTLRENLLVDDPDERRKRGWLRNLFSGFGKVLKQPFVAMTRGFGRARSRANGTNDMMDDLMEALRNLSPEEFDIYYKGIHYGHYGRRDKVPNAIREAIERVYQERGKDGEELADMNARPMSKPELQRTDWEVKGMLEQLRDDQERAEEIEQLLASTTDQNQINALTQERDAINARALQLIPRIIQLRDEAAMTQGGFGDRGRLDEQKAHDEGSDLDGLRWAKRSSYDDEAHAREADLARARREALETGNGADARKAFLDQEDYMHAGTQNRRTLGMSISCGEFHHARGTLTKSYEEDTLLQDVMFAVSIGIVVHGVGHAIGELVKVANYNKLVDAVNNFNTTSATNKAAAFRQIQQMATKVGIDLKDAGTMEQQVEDLLRQLAAHEFAGNSTLYTFTDPNGTHNAVDTLLHQSEHAMQPISGTVDYWLQQLGQTLGLDPRFPKDFMEFLVNEIQQGGGVGVIQNGILSGENLVNLIQQFNPNIPIQTLQHIALRPDFVTPIAMGTATAITGAEAEKRKRAEVLKQQLYKQVGVNSEEELMNNPAAQGRLLYILRGMQSDEAERENDEDERDDDERDDDDER